MRKVLERQPTPHGRLAKLHFAADLTRAEAWLSNHLHHLQLELSVKRPSLLPGHVSRPGGFHLRGVRGN